jgi:phasin family protein
MTTGARDVSRQALGFAEENVAAAFAFAEKLVRARDPQEFMQLQSEFAKETMQKLTDQSKAMGEQMQTAAREATKPRT